MTIGKCRIARLGGRSPGRHVRIHRAVKRAERVEESLDMAAGQRGRCLSGRAHERRISDEDFVRPIAVPDPRLVGLFRVPGEGRVGTVDLVVE